MDFSYQTSVIVSPGPARGPAPAPALPRAATAAPPRAAQAPRPAGRAVRARYDAAVTTDENRRHWAWADSLSAKAANSLAVRHQLRNRTRYELANNSYVQGMVWTLANDTIGTGPRLQLLTDDAGLNAALEAAWQEWATAIKLGPKLWQMRCSQVVDGEMFGLFITNPAIAPQADVSLDIKTIEADQVTTPFLNPADPYAVDGIRYDHAMNPVEYSLLRYHPGDPVQLGYFVDTVDARYVLHWFRRTRPGQCRGVPDLTPGLPLGAQLRRWSQAVLSAAETAANFAGMLYSEMPASPDGDAEAEPFERLDIDRGTMMTLPGGWKFSQLKAEQPTTTYGDFKGEGLKELGRGVNMPRNVVSGDSSNYNYASGRLDHQIYHAALKVDRRQIEHEVLDRAFFAWLDELGQATDLVRVKTLRASAWKHRWFWDGVPHVDPEKEASAQEVRLRNRTSSYASEYAREGRDWRAEFEQLAKEQALAQELGIMLPGLTAPSAAAPQPQPPTQPPATPARRASRPAEVDDAGDDEGTAQATGTTHDGITSRGEG